MARVLLVDDDAEGVELRRMILERHGHAVATAANPMDALQWIAEHPMDCAVCDLRLPEMEDGIALIRDLHRQYPSVRILVLSGIGASLDALEERRYVHEVLIKPIRSEQLVHAIAKL